MLSLLEVKNFRKHKHSKVEFGEGVIGIIGPNESGKTTFFSEGIGFALFGADALRDSKDEVVTHGCKGGTSSRVKIGTEEGMYEIYSDFSKATFALHTKSGSECVNGITSVNKSIVDQLHTNKKIFELVHLARQGEIAMLSNLIPCDRKAYILRMLNVDRIDAYILPRIKEEINSIQADLSNIVLFDSSSIKKDLDRNNSLLDSVVMDRNTSESGLRDASVVYLNMKNRVESLSDRVKVLDGKRTIVTQKKEEVSGLRSKETMLTELILSSSVDEGRVAECMQGLKGDALSKANVKLTNMDKLERAWNDNLSRQAERDSLIKRKDTLSSWLAGNLRLDNSDIERKLVEISSRREAVSRQRAELKSTLDGVIFVGKQVRTNQESAKKLSAGVCSTCFRPLSEEDAKVVVGQLEKELVSLRDKANKIKLEISEFDVQLSAIEEEHNELNALYMKNISHNEKVVEVEKEVQEIGTEIFEKDVTAIKYSVIAHQNARATVKILQELSDELSLLMDKKTKHDNYCVELNIIKLKIVAFDNDISSLSKDILELTGLESEYKQARVFEVEYLSRVNKFKDDIKHFDGRILEYNENINELNKRLKEQADNELKHKDLNVKLVTHNKLYSAMKSFRVAIISKIRPLLEAYTSDMVSALMDYDGVEIDEDYELTAIDGENRIAFRSMSTGAQMLVSICLRLAISRLVSEAHASCLDFIILDEPTAYLDSNRKVAVIEKIIGLKSMYKQVFIITHENDIAKYMDQVYIVNSGSITQSNGG